MLLAGLVNIVFNFFFFGLMVMILNVHVALSAFSLCPNSRDPSDIDGHLLFLLLLNGNDFECACGVVVWL